MRTKNDQRKTPSKGTVKKERSEKLKKKEKVSTPSVMKYFRKVEKPQFEKSLSGGGGLEEIQTLSHTVQLGGESSQKKKICANPAVPSLNKLSGTQEKIIYEGTAQEYKVSQNNIHSQNVKTSYEGGEDGTAMFTVQNSCASGQNKTE